MVAWAAGARDSLQRIDRGGQREVALREAAGGLTQRDLALAGAIGAL